MNICFFFNDTATTEIYTLSLHDALPILLRATNRHVRVVQTCDLGIMRVYECYRERARYPLSDFSDRKSTRLNSSHSQISYAVFCLKKKTTYKTRAPLRLPLSPRNSC